jgi:rfaE bifunctional protein kinase chain/domain
MSLTSLESIFESLGNVRALVIGDVMVDAYIWGSADRISPEAPVPVVKTTNQEYRLGGAANVALNLKSLGAEPILCSVIGNDSEGNRFIERLSYRDIDASAIVRSSSRPTTVKTRVLSGYQHIVRIDSEEESPLSHEEETALLEKIFSHLGSCNVVVFEDYDKGTLSGSLISKVLEKTIELNIPTVVDPKKKNFFDFKGVTVFKPNLKELIQGLKLDHDPETIPEILTAVEQLRQEIDAREIFLTLSEKGVLIKGKEDEIHIPAHIRTISDVSGAGDTVISIIAICKALGLSSQFTAELANLGGGLVCEHVGVVPVDKDELLQEAEKYNISSTL